MFKRSLDNAIEKIKDMASNKIKPKISGSFNY